MRSDAWVPNEEVSAAVISDYEGGMSARKVAQKYGVVDVTVTAFLKRHGVEIRNRSGCRRKWSLDENAFDELSDEAFYWIGFLLADGNVYHPEKRSKQLNVGLSEKDAEHLEKLKKFLGCNKPLYYNKGGVFFSVYSNKLCDRLAEFGIVPRKSLIATVPEVCKDNRHFWRGMVDGDGWLIYQPQLNNYRIGLCGTQEVIESFAEFSETDNKIYDKKCKCFEIIFQGSTCIRITSALYSNCSISLKRKAFVYKDMMGKLSGKQSKKG